MPLLYHKTVYDVLTLPVYYLTTLYTVPTYINLPFFKQTERFADFLF